MPLRQAIEDMTVAHLFNPGELPRSLMWSDNELVLMRRAAERIAVHRDVSQGQNRFRLVYAVGTQMQEREVGFGCPVANEPHFHRRVKRIGHLPMFTVKDLPE